MAAALPEHLDLHTWRGADRRGPVNVVFAAPLDEVVLHLRRDGWRRTRARWREIDVAGVRHRQDVDLVRGSWWDHRLHVRLWGLDGVTVGQAHFEVRTWGRRGRVGSHKVLSQDRGREAVAASFVGSYAPGAATGTDHDGRIFVAHHGRLSDPSQ